MKQKLYRKRKEKNFLKKIIGKLFFEKILIERRIIFGPGGGDYYSKKFSWGKFSLIILFLFVVFLVIFT